MAGRLVQGRLGYCSFTPAGGSTQYIPVFDWNIQSNRGYVTGDPVGNSWSTNFAPGLLTSRFTARILCRQNTTEAFDSTFLDYFVNRTVTNGLDDTKAFTIVASDGIQTHTLANAKPESFTLTVAKGSPIGLSVVFVSPSGPTQSSADAVTTSTLAYAQTVDGTPTLMFNSATFATAANIAGLDAGTAITDFYNAELSWSNNHIVNAPLDGTLNAASYDAGIMRASATFTVRANYGSSDDALFAPTGGAAVRIELNLGSSSIINFDMSQVVVNTDLNSSANVGASFRSWQCLVLGVGGGSPLPPLQITRS